METQIYLLWSAMKRRLKPDLTREVIESTDFIGFVIALSQSLPFELPHTALRYLRLGW